MDGVQTASITITRTIYDTDDEHDIVSVELEGDADKAIVALGMLDLARDAILRRDEWPDEDDDG